MGDGYDSDTSGCSSSSEDLIVLGSAVAAASAFMSILRTYAITGSHSNGMHRGTRGGSTPGKAGNRERCRVDGAARMDADYFRRGDAAGRASTFNERNFERRSALPLAMGSCTRFLRGEGGLLRPPKCHSSPPSQCYHWKEELPPSQLCRPGRTTVLLKLVPRAARLVLLA
jgi:hypothetical protein